MEKVKRGQSASSAGKGLDVGTSFIHSAEKKGEDVTFKTQRDAFFDLENNDFTKKMLEKSKINFVKKGEGLYVLGDEAVGFANIFNREVRRPLAKGVISPQEREALPVVELLIKSVLGEPKEKGEILYYSVPSRPLDADFLVVYHQKVLERYLRSLGFAPKAIEEGLAVILSELPEEKFTGIGVSFGGGMTNICLAYFASPVVSFSVARGGDWIDQQVAVAVGETAARVCALKESKLNLGQEQGLSKVEEALSIYYTHLIEYVLVNFKRELERMRNIPDFRKPIPIVLSGGTALPKGFLERFEKMLSEIHFPIEIGEVRMATQPLYTVAKGALVAAMAEEVKG
ncbi:hypothetical protein L6258_03000 [Candidatus Parcubacteria bacterium]|nr:hypothetical protein [Candidatus Parcubacteria bacterium]